MVWSMLPAKVATLVMEVLCTLLVIGLQPLFLPASSREPGALPLLLDLCVYTISPSVLCFPVSCQILLIPIWSFGASCQLPEAIRTLLVSALHATLPAQHLTVFLHIYAISMSLPIPSFLNLKSFEAINVYHVSYSPTPFFNACLLTHLEQPASVPVFFQHNSFQSGKFSGSLGFTYL